MITFTKTSDSVEVNFGGAEVHYVSSHSSVQAKATNDYVVITEALGDRPVREYKATVTDIANRPNDVTLTVAAWLRDNFFNGGDVPNLTNGGADVNIQDQHTPSVDTYFLKELSGFTVAVDTPLSTLTTLYYDFVATAGHGIITGDELLLIDIADDRVFYCEVLNVVTNTITIDRPFDNSFPAATSLGRVVTSNMNVNGAVTPQIFTIRGGAIVEHDMTRFFLTMLSSNSMDDGKFGSLTKLTRGLVLRIINGTQVVIFNFKTNNDIKQFCYDLTYSDKAPAGQFGLSSRMSFAGQDKHGVTLRISGLDAIQWIVQDDLTGLLSLKASGQGHHVE